MASFQEMKSAAIVQLYELAQTWDTESEDISGATIKNVIAKAVGGGFTSAIFDDLLHSRLIRQTRTSSDDRGGYWVFTSDFIIAADDILQQNESAPKEDTGPTPKEDSISFA